MDREFIAILERCELKIKFMEFDGELNMYVMHRQQRCRQWSTFQTNSSEFSTRYTLWYCSSNDPHKKRTDFRFLFFESRIIYRTCLEILCDCNLIWKYAPCQHKISTIVDSTHFQFPVVIRKYNWNTKWIHEIIFVVVALLTAISAQIENTNMITVLTVNRAYSWMTIVIH